MLPKPSKQCLNIIASSAKKKKRNEWIIKSKKKKKNAKFCILCWNCYFFNFKCSSIALDCDSSECVSVVSWFVSTSVLFNIQIQEIASYKRWIEKKNSLRIDSFENWHLSSLFFLHFNECWAWLWQLKLKHIRYWREYSWLVSSSSCEMKFELECLLLLSLLLFSL